MSGTQTTRQFSVDDVRIGSQEYPETKIEQIYAKAGSTYAVYRTEARVSVRSADDAARAQAQRKNVAPLNADHPEKYLGQSVGDGECVAFVRAAAHVPQTALWRRGRLAKGDATVPRGAAIATFDPDGRYGNHTDGRSHAAIYLSQDEHGLTVLDQWRQPSIHVVQSVLSGSGAPFLSTMEIPSTSLLRRCTRRPLS